MESKVDPHAMRANIKKCLAGGKTGPWVGPVIRSVEGQMHPAGGGTQLKVATAPDLREGPTGKITPPEFRKPHWRLFRGRVWDVFL